MSLPLFALFLPLALVAEMVGTIAGFGASTILVPTASLFLEIKTAITLVALFHFFGTLFRTIFFRGGINWRLWATFGLPSLVAAGIGASLFTLASAKILFIVLGLFLIAFATVNLAGKKVALPQKDWVAVLGGSLVGLLAGLIGTAGALRGAFLASWKLEKNLYLGTGAAIGLGADLVRVGVYAKSGILSLEPTTVASLAAVAFLGTFLGRKIVVQTQSLTFRKIVLVALFLAGLRFLFI